MKSYLKFLSRNKLYTAVEAVGLVVSLAFVIIIGSYVWQQYAIAHSTPDGERVYAVSADNYFFGLSWWDKACFEEEIPEVETACRIGSTDEDAIVTYKGEPFNAIVTYGDPELFEIFSDHPVVDGSLEPYRLKGQCLVSDPTFTPAKAHFPCWRGLAFQSGGRCDLQIFIFLNGASL